MKKLLIANRGEIAVRVIRAARGLGIKAVAVYSDADADAIHVALADEAVPIGPSEASQSYLDPEKVLAAAKATGADAIHPGYGFLSERAEFAEACEAAGITFVGPPAEAMRKLGAKIDAKALAVQSGVPVVPGFFEAGASHDDLAKAADEIGYPVMLKASAGGGGRGMRVVRSSGDVRHQLQIAADEAENAFGDGSMMVEKLIERPRHVEVQILADRFGNIACLFERECSIQRRHQKLIEECPATVWNQVSGISWDQMRDAARNLIRSAGYVGAGTVEFMVDPSEGRFYFLEVNARLQVEHPVTEQVTGLDLVQWQLRVAAGEKLAIDNRLIEGDRDALCGHSIEARIVAEDPGHNFLPSSGKLLAWAEPKGPGVRVDTGYGPGGEVPRQYDSLIAKVICHGATREDAISRLEGALLDFHILGVKTNIAFLLDVLAHPRFKSGEIDTGFIDRELPSWTPGPVPEELGSIASHASDAAASENQDSTVWDRTDGFRIVCQ